MSVVPLVSGGVDSTLMSVLIREQGMKQHPLFIHYGQVAATRELSACKRAFRRHKLPSPEIINLAGYGKVIRSGLTDKTKRIFEDAFLPCRNLLFLVTAAAFAYQKNAEAIAIGFLHERMSIFPDQTKGFADQAERLLGHVLGRSIKVLTPLMAFSKAEIVAAAKLKGIVGTYSCHAGTAAPCGICVACREFEGVEA